MGGRLPSRGNLGGEGGGAVTTDGPAVAASFMFVVIFVVSSLFEIGESIGLEDISRDMDL